MNQSVSVFLVTAMLAVAFAPELAAAASSSPKPTYGPQDLWGGILGPIGWGFLLTTVTNPGPTITVAPSEIVNLTLFSADGIPHVFYVDYNGNNLSDVPGEPTSGNFGGATGLSFQFTAPATPGKYWYKCGFHEWGMRGQFIVAGAGNQPPTIQLTNPDGVAQNRWTGGSLHRLTWNMMDPDDPPGALIVWLNYTANAGANQGPIAGPLRGLATFDWTVPMIDAADARVLADISDGRGGRASDNRLIPIIDSTGPHITTESPADGTSGIATNAPIVVTFSEAMNTALTETAFSLNPPAAPLTFTWSNGNQTLTVDHATFGGNVRYTATVGAGAKDASDPGNALVPGGTPNPWQFTTINTAPSLTVTSPGAGVRWTGGTTHTLAWTASDVEDPASSLTVNVDYSPTGGAPWTHVLGPVSGTVTSFNWAVPLVDTTAAKTQTTVNDTGGATSSVLSGPFVIDSTPPIVSGTNPSGGANGVALNTNVAIAFSEVMNKAVTGVPSVVGLQAIASGAWVALAFSWDGPGVVLTANPSANLQALTRYRIFVNASALDASDPGNAMTAGSTFDFTTGSSVDTTPPTITNVQVVPPTNRTGGSIDISATVQDNVLVASVSVNVVQPDATAVNRAMTDRGANRWGDTNAWTQVGTYAFTISALDSSGNPAAPATGSFQITTVDSTAPVIQHTSPTGTIRVGDAITITATVTDADGQSDVAVVKLDYTDTAGVHHNVSMMSSGGSAYTTTIPAQAAAGTLTYHIYAEDAAGNWNVTLAFSLDVHAAAPSPPSDYTLVFLGLAIVAAAVVAALFLLARRRKKDDDLGPESPPMTPEK